MNEMISEMFVNEIISMLLNSLTALQCCPALWGYPAEEGEVQMDLG